MSKFYVEFSSNSWKWFVALDAVEEAEAVMLDVEDVVTLVEIMVLIVDLVQEQLAYL